MCSNKDMRSRTSRIQNSGIYVLSVLVVFCAMIWYAVYYFEATSDVVVHFFDVGQGDGIFFELPNHVQVLIDGGPGNSILAKLGNVMPFWDRTIDLVVLTHPHADHLDGLIDVLKRYHVGMVIESGASYATPDYYEWQRLLSQKSMRVIHAYAGMRFILSEQSTLDILHPFKKRAGMSFANIHDAMVVSKLTHGSSTMLFMGDAERMVEYQLVGLSTKDSLAVDVLKIGHHGSKTSTTQGLLDATNPRIAVISAGRKNRYGHPYQEVVDRIREAGIALFRTDIDGDVTLMSDGKRVWREGD